ncbi:MAG: DUF1440 domain-containing protein [Segetibacter sp.]
MKNKTSNETSADLAVGALAGIIGGFALAGAAQTIYSLTSPKTIAEETAIEPRDPFIVLAEKLEKLTGKNLNDRQKKIFEQGAAAALSVTAGVSYALLASKWNLNWLMGGAVFGGLFWAAGDEGILPVLGLAGDNTKYPLEAHARGLAAHVVFGIVTAAFVKAAGTADEE